MKELFLFALLLLLPSYNKAQDTIVKRNGETTIVKLLEVNPHDVRYKRFDYPDGPLFTVSKQDIKFIVYGNGVKESFENYVAPLPIFTIPDLSIQTSGIFYIYKERRILEPDMLAIVRKTNDPKINLMIKKVEDKKFIQRTTLIASVPLFASGAYIYVANRPSKKRSSITNSSRVNAQQNGKYLMFGALGCDLVSVYFYFDRRKHDRIVVNAYNKNLATLR